MVRIARAFFVGAMISAARGQRPPISSPSTDGAAEKTRAEDRLLSIDPFQDDEDFVDAFDDVASAMTMGLNGGKLRVFTRHSGKGLDRLFTLDFGFVQELDANGQKLKGRSVKISNAASKQDAELVAAQGVVGGARALITRLSMPLAFSECNATSVSGKGYSGNGQTGKGSTGKGRIGKGRTGKGRTGKGRTGKGRLLSEDIDNDTPDLNSIDDANASDAEYEDELQDEDLLEDEDEDLLEDEDFLDGEDEVSGDDMIDDDLHTDIPGNFVIEAFVFLDNASVEYGDEIMEVNRGQLKFNFASSAWPFCGSGHSLLVDMGVHLKGNNHKAKHFGEVGDDLDTEDYDVFAEASELIDESDKDQKRGKGKDKEEPKGGKGKGEDKEDSADDADEEPNSGKGGKGNQKKQKDETERKHEGKKGKHGRHRKMLLADSGETEVFMDMPTLVLVDGSLVNCSVDLDAKGDKLGIAFTFPAFNDTLVYDPIAGTSVDLSMRSASKGVADVQDERSNDSGLGEAEEAIITGRSAPGMGSFPGLQHMLAGWVLVTTIVP